MAIRRGISLSRVFPDTFELLSSLPPFREMLGDNEIRSLPTKDQSEMKTNQL